MAVPRVLIVDKDHETCAYASDVLADSGFHVAGNGQTALQKCKSHDLLLVESHLPDMDGVELFRRAKRLRANIRAILITPARTLEKLRAAIDAGMWDVLSKPLNANQLVRMIEEAAGETA
jgi:CheY-like chemotaxis protein